MNGLEHYKITTEDITGLRFGEVISNEDSEGLGRIKVRVRGLFEEPIKKEHIPWAEPVMGCDVPQLGTEVGVLFLQEDIERPLYFPENFMNTEFIENLLELYQKVIDAKKDAVKTGVSVSDSSFDEPETEAEATFTHAKDVKLKYDSASETTEGVDEGTPTTAMMWEREWTDGGERWSVYHVEGSWMEYLSDGSKVDHVGSNLYEIVEGARNEYTVGTRLSKVDGAYKLQADGGVTIVVGSGATAATIEMDASGAVTVKGAEFNVTGLATPTAGQGAWCALPQCVFSGAVHIGKTAANNT